MESLEARSLLSVSLDAGGWTVVTPNADSHLFYVSSSTGSDTNDGLSQSTPVATITRAMSLLRNGHPDWLLFKRGDTFNGIFYFSPSGLSATDPMVVTNYGDPTLPRPIIDGGPQTVFRMGNNNHDVYVMGIDFTTSTHDPTSPNFTNQGSYGFYDLGGTNDLLIEDCRFRNFVNDITFQGYYAPLSNITIRRNQILDAYSTFGHAQGMYADTVTNLTIDQNVFDHDGWNANVPGAQATIFNHDCYLHSSNINCVVTNNIFADAGSFGLQARAGGIIDNNLFVGDPYGFSFGLVNGATTKAGGVTGEAVGNVVLAPRIDNAAGWGVGAMIGNLKPGGGTTISNNIFSEDQAGNQPALQFLPGVGVVNPTDEVGLNTLVVSNNTIYNWGFGLSLSNQFVPGTVGSTGLTAIVIRNNNFQNNVTGRIVSQGAVFDPRYEDWSGNAYASTSIAQSNWFTVQGAVASLATWQANIEPTAVARTIPFINPTRTVESYMLSQGLTGTVASFTGGARTLSKTNWNPIYFAGTVDSYIHAGFLVDTNPPVTGFTPPADVTAANYQVTPTPTFTVTFNDDVGVDATTLTGSNVTITGPGGFSLPVSLVSTSSSGATAPFITATYLVSAANGNWTTVPYGTYIVSIVGGQVKDTSGNAVAAGPLGSFQVTVNPDPNPPFAPATVPNYLSSLAGTSSISLSWADSAGDQRSYILQRAVDAGFTQQVQNFAMRGDVTSYVDISAAVGVTYHYQLIAVNPLGVSAPTAATVATILPAAPVLTRVSLNDGNSARTAITAVTLVFSTPVTLNSTMVSLVQNPFGAPTPIPVTVSNPTGDGLGWVVSWAIGTFNNALPDGSYSLTVHRGSITDQYGQIVAGGDQTTGFNSITGPVVTAVNYYNSAPPHAFSVTFSQDVSASLNASSLKLSPSVPVTNFGWNPSTLTGTWTFNGALPDAKYTASFSANTVFNRDSVALDGNADGIPGDAYSYTFTQVKPTLTISGAANANVGAPYSLNLGAITDAGENSPTYLVHWGDGTTSAYTNPGVVTYTYSSVLGPIKILVDVVDANGTHTSAATLSVSVNRATIALSGAAYANPGATYTLNLGAVNDPGFTVSQYIVHWGDTSSNTYFTNGPVTHVYANAKTAAVAAAITVDLVDNSGFGGASNTNTSVSTLGVTINPSPTVLVSGDFNANVGGTYRLVLSPPSDTGFTVSMLTVNWGDNSPTTSVAPPLATTTTVVTHTFTSATAPATDTITVTLTDDSGTYSNAGTLKVTVNLAPTVTLAGSGSANVGGTYLLNVAPAVEVGQTVSAYTINWGDGTSTPSATPGNFTHVYGLAGNALITVDVTDATGTFIAAGSRPVTVNNAPTIALNGNTNANTNGIYTLNLGAVNDPGQTVTQYQVRWGDGQSNFYSPGSTAATHTYTTSGSDTINVDVYDGTGVYLAAGMLPVTVSPPSVSLTGNTGAFQGQGYSLTINSADDPGGTPSQYVVDWGDGTTSTYASSGTVSHIFAQHVYSSPKQVIITTDLVDNTGTFLNAGSLPITIAPPPTVSLVGANSVLVNSTYALSLGAVNDAIGTVFSYIVHWGDNTTSTYPINSSASHVYGTAGPVTIVVDTIDQNGTYVGAGSLALSVTNQTVSAPALVSSVVGDGTVQRSTLDSFSVVFNEAVNFKASSFTLSYETVADNQAVQNGGRSVTPTFTPLSNANDLNFSSPNGGITWIVSPKLGGAVDRTAGAGDGSGLGVFLDGVYSLNLHGAAITDLATGSSRLNNGLDQAVRFADGTGTVYYQFSVLFGDIAGTANVTANDNKAFSKAFLTSSGDSGYNAAFDYTATNSSINANDNKKFAKNFLVTLLLS